MSRQKTKLESAAGKLISTIQKEWGVELGESVASVSEDVMGLAHNLLQAVKKNTVSEVLNGRTTGQYLGEIWVKNHPAVQVAIHTFDKLLNERGNV